MTSFLSLKCPGHILLFSSKRGQTAWTADGVDVIYVRGIGTCLDVVKSSNPCKLYRARPTYIYILCADSVCCVPACSSHRPVVAPHAQLQHLIEILQTSEQLAESPEGASSQTAPTDPLVFTHTRHLEIQLHQ